MGWIYVVAVLFLTVYLLKKTGGLQRLHDSFYVKIILLYAEKYNYLVEPRKRELFADLHLRARTEKKPLKLLEIGPGGGTNFPLYPKNVQMVCVEPKEKFRTHLEENAKKHLQPVSLKIIQEYANGLEMFDDESFDAVILTMVMCSIEDHRQLLAAVKRVLKPGSKMYYLEHVRGEGWMLCVQYAFKLFWPYLFDGCSHTRDTWRSVDQAGFSEVRQQRFTAGLPLHYYPLRPQLIGWATK